jgi:hypothetical protein
MAPARGGRTGGAGVFNVALSIPHGLFMLMGWTRSRGAIALAGIQTELPYMLGVVPMAVTNWKRHRVRRVAIENVLEAPSRASSYGPIYS